MALVWNDLCAERSWQADVLTEVLRRQAHVWRNVLNGSGLRVWCAGSIAKTLEASVLPNDGGVILGRVFHRGGGDPHDALASASTAVERARSLIENCWGRYVAVLQGTPARRTLIVRDPSGAMRCFHTANEGVHVICSNTEDAAALGLRFTINWDYVAAELANRAGMGWEQTGLREVSALRGGECLEIADDVVQKRLYWDPVRIATQSLDDAAEGAREVRRVVRNCVHAWASCQAHVGLLLSGGLDSSVLLSCLQSAPVRPLISCLNYFHAAAKADERTYARIVAQRANCQLVELARSTDVRLETLLNLPLSARPSHNRLDQVLHAERSAGWAREIGASAVLTGDLGDQLFGQQLSRFAATDCARRYGIGRRLLEVSRDVARMTQLGIWTPVSAALVLGRLGRHRKLRRLAAALYSPETNPYLDSRALGRLNYRLLDRWLESVADVPIGKLHHIASMLSGQAYLTPIGDDDDPEWMAPLNSQPIIELCLRLPLYVLIEGGWDRALFRRAFAAELPAQIAWRHTKGTTSTQRVAVYSGNAAFLQRMLLEGVLASAGLLDLSRLASDLKARDYRNNIWLERCIRAETWLRIWDSERASKRPYMSCSARYVYSNAS